MPNYKEMYLKLFRASEQAINALIDAQRTCEELYIADAEPTPRALVLPTQKRESMDKTKAKFVLCLYWQKRVTQPSIPCHCGATRHMAFYFWSDPADNQRWFYNI